MLQYVYNQHEAVAQFVAQFIPHVRERGFGKCKAIGVIDETGMAIAGLVYHNYLPEFGLIEMSGGALPGKQWLTRETIARMYQYPFLQCDCQQVVMRISADDLRLQRQLGALGYMFVEWPRMLGRDQDGILALLMREHWETNKFCKRFRHHMMPAQLNEAA